MEEYLGRFNLHSEKVRSIGTAVVLITVFLFALKISGSFNTLGVSASSGDAGFFSPSNDFLWGGMIFVEVAFFGTISRLAPKP